MTDATYREIVRLMRAAALAGDDATYDACVNALAGTVEDRRRLLLDLWRPLVQR